MPLEEKNPVLMLNDIRKDCVYQELAGDAENSERRFIFKLSIDGKTFEGAGPNKKTAKAAAANRALMHPAVNPNASAYKAQQQKKNQKQNKQQGNQNKKSQPNPGLASGKKPQPNIGNNKMMFGNNGMQFRNTGMQYNNAGMHLHNTGMQFGKNSLTERGFNMMKSPMVNNDDVYVDGRKVCPFYLNSMCVKGNLCQFYHPTYSSRLDSAISSERQNVYQRLEMPQSSASQQVPSGDTFTWLQFCQNYSHLRCPRTDCKFLHVSRDEEEVVRASGRIPSHIVEQAVRKAMLDDIAPAGVTQPCKAYLEGQCSWYSCPFRHISRQEFSHEVVDLLRKEFENRVKPGSDYRLLANRLLDRDPFSQESRRPIDRPNYPYDKDMGLGSLSRREDYLMSGMKSLSLDQNFTAKQREVEDLRTQLNMLHDENERLRNDMRMRSEDEKLMELKRRELMHEELRMQERFEKLKAENESLRGLRGNSFSIPSQHITGNAAYGPNYYSDMRHEMKRQNPESYSFDELLNTGLRRNTNQGYAQMLGIPLQNVKKSQTSGQKAGKGKINTQINKMPVKKSGQILQTAARPSFHIKVLGGKNGYVPANQKKTKPQQNQPKGNSNQGKNQNQTAKQGKNQNRTSKQGENQNQASDQGVSKSASNKKTNKNQKNENKPGNVNNKNTNHSSNGAADGGASKDSDVVIEETREEVTKSEENSSESQGCEAKENDDASGSSDTETKENDGATGSTEKSGAEGDSKCDNDDQESSHDDSTGSSECSGVGSKSKDEDQDSNHDGSSGSSENSGEGGNDNSEEIKDGDKEKGGEKSKSDRWVDAAEDGF